MAPKADQPVSKLNGFVQLTKSGKLRYRAHASSAALMPFGFFSVEHTPAQGGSNADDRVELVAADKAFPLAGKIAFVLRGDN